MDDEELIHPAGRMPEWMSLLKAASFVVPAACGLLTAWMYSLDPTIILNGAATQVVYGMCCSQDWNYCLAKPPPLPNVPGPFGLPAYPVLACMMVLNLPLLYVLLEMLERAVAMLLDLCVGVYESHKRVASPPSPILPSDIRASVPIRLLYKIWPLDVADYTGYIVDSHYPMWVKRHYGSARMTILTVYLLLLRLSLLQKIWAKLDDFLLSHLETIRRW